MPGTKYKHHDVVVAWLEGKVIQVKGGSKWTDMQTSAEATCLPVFNVATSYRIKPDPVVVKYKRFLYGLEPQSYIVKSWSVADEGTGVEPRHYYGRYFAGWIDTEWQEYIVDEA